MRYGIPYQGSKNGIVEWLCSQLPTATHFYDMFAGGCAVTHRAMLLKKYKYYHANDICDAPKLFLDAINGKYHDERRWISREDFFMLKDTDPYIRYCWSFGNGGDSYLYAKEIEPFKKRLWALMFADSVSERMTQWRAFVAEFDRLNKDVEQLRAYCVNLCNECGVTVPRRADGTPNTDTMKKLLTGAMTKEIREYLCTALKESGKTQAEVCEFLGNQMASHYFGECQWALPTAENYAKMQTIMPALTKPWASLNESLQSLQRLQRLQRLESLQRLERLQRLQSLQSLQSLEVTQGDYRDIDILPDSVVYCDIPYKETAAYNNTEFDHDAFYTWALQQEQRVFISEYSMPSDFVAIAEIQKNRLMNGKGADGKAVEKIFIPKTQVEIYKPTKQQTLFG